MCACERRHAWIFIVFTILPVICMLFYSWEYVYDKANDKYIYINVDTMQVSCAISIVSIGPFKLHAMLVCS